MAPRGDGGLHVRVGTDLGTFADDLGGRLSSSPLAVFEPELVIVPSMASAMAGVPALAHAGSRARR